MSLCEDISGLIGGGNRSKSNGAMGKVMTHKMTINLNMFCAFMEDIIVSNLDSTLIVTIDDSGSGVSDSHVLE